MISVQVHTLVQTYFILYSSFLVQVTFKALEFHFTLLLKSVVISGEREVTFPFVFCPFSYFYEEILSLSCDISAVDATPILTESIFF